MSVVLPEGLVLPHNPIVYMDQHGGLKWDLAKFKRDTYSVLIKLQESWLGMMDGCV